MLQIALKDIPIIMGIDKKHSPIELYKVYPEQLNTYSWLEEEIINHFSNQAVVTYEHSKISFNDIELNGDYSR